jgi:chromosome segregation ATPase
MEKERAIQCVPVELIERLKALAAKLWDDRNPASVQLNTILEEFGPDMKTLGNIIKDYEADYSGRLAASQSKFEQKESRLKKEVEDLKARQAGIESSRAEALKKSEELKAAFAARESLLADLRMKTTEDEGALNSKYVARMQELYEKVNKKELEMLSRWEEKNKAVETKLQELEGEYAARGRQLKLRERALEEDFNARKAELIKTFDRIRAGLEAKEKELSAREETAAKKGGTI